MSKPNSLNSAGAGHNGPHLSIRERQTPLSHRQRSLCSEGNIRGKNPILREEKALRAANLAHIEMRQDERFSGINTMHPSKSGKFVNQETPTSKKRRK